MTGWTPLAVCLTAGATGLFLLRRQVGALGRLFARSAAGLALLWLFNLVGGLAGMHIGLNLLTGLIVGALGLPGFGLILLLQCL
jgi:inhibitor of the pro-sigma K processing machinery